MLGVVGVTAKLEAESLIRCLGYRISEITLLSCKEIWPSIVQSDIQTIKKQFKPYVIGKIIEGKKKVKLDEKVFW